MKFNRIISAVDSHTEGEPARVVVGGVPYIPGLSFQDKWQWAKENLEDLRKLLMFATASQEKGIVNSTWRLPVRQAIRSWLRPRK